MTASPEIDALAARLVALPLRGLSERDREDRITEVLDDADQDIAQAALIVACEIMGQRAAEAARQSAVLVSVRRLSHATSCPPETSPLRWCADLGLVEQDDQGCFSLTPKASLRLVRAERW
jgi:hypothetical protein